jgi:hypothetical protein
MVGLTGQRKVVKKEAMSADRKEESTADRSVEQSELKKVVVREERLVGMKAGKRGVRKVVSKDKQSDEKSVALTVRTTALG